MKVIKTITIDVEIHKKLQDVDNGSGLINELLINHFRIGNKSEENIIDEVKAKIEEKEEAKRFQKRQDAEVTEI